MIDLDGDGLLNGQEYHVYGTHPYKKDTDADGLSDGEEIKQYQTDPLDNDTDNDTMLDGEEVQRMLSNLAAGRSRCPVPTDRDSDSDGIVDGFDPFPCVPQTPVPSW